MYRAAPHNKEYTLFLEGELFLRFYTARRTKGKEVESKAKALRNLFSVNVSCCHVKIFSIFELLQNIPMRSPGKNPAKSKQNILKAMKALD